MVGGFEKVHFCGSEEKGIGWDAENSGQTLFLVLSRKSVSDTRALKSSSINIVSVFPKKKQLRFWQNW